MRKLVLFLFLLPFLAQAQVSGTAQITSSTNTVRVTTPTGLIDSLAVVQKNSLANLDMLRWNAATLKFIPRTPAQVLSDIGGAPSSGSSSYWTANSTQTGLTGDKTTSGSITIGNHINVGPTNTLTSNVTVYGDTIRNGAAFGTLNKLYSWWNLAGGAGNYVDGKISSAFGNTNIATANDSHVDGNRNVIGRKSYPVLSQGVDNPGLGIGNRAYVIVDELEGDVTAYFPNSQLDGNTSYINANYETGYTISGGYVTNPANPEDTWRMPPYMILRSSSEETDISLRKILKADYSGGVGTKIYYDTTASVYPTISWVYGSYAPTVKVHGVAPGNGLHGSGLFTSAYGTAAQAGGGFTRAWASYANAQNLSTTATGVAATAFGFSTNANVYAHLVGGRYNVGGGTSDGWVTGDPLFELGNGTSTSSRSNAFRVLKNGNTNVYGTFAVAGATTLGGDLDLGSNNISMTGSLGSTGSRLTKGWFTDLQVTNAIAGSITGNAATVTTNANLTGDVTSSGNATTLATVNSNVGSFTNASITVNAKGLITAASNGTAGITTMAAAGGSPNANGASISGSTLTLQPASATFPGILSTTAQDISGDKSFKGSTIDIGGGSGANLQLNRGGGTTLGSLILHRTNGTTLWQVGIKGSNSNAYSIENFRTGSLVSAFSIDSATNNIAIAGTLTSTASADAANAVTVDNNSAGTSASSRVIVQNDQTAVGQLITYSSGFSPNLFGGSVANATAILSSGASSTGLIAGTLTATPIRLGTNNTLGLTMDGSTQVVTLSAGLSGLLVTSGGTGVKMPVSFSGTTTTAATSEYIIGCSATQTMNLPSAVTVGAGKQYVIYVSAAATTVTIDPNGSETINGAATKVLAVQYSGVQITSDGGNWIITATF